MQARPRWVLEGWGRSTSAVTVVCQALCLFGHQVGDHVGRMDEGGGEHHPARHVGDRSGCACQCGLKLVPRVLVLQVPVA